MADTAKAAGKKKAGQKGKGIPVPGARKIVNQDLAGFTRQLGAMLAAGMPVVSCLNALEEQTDNKNFKPVVRQVRESLEGGMVLSDAFRQFPTVFDPLYCNMIGGGERSGELAETIARLAGFLESSAKLRRKVKSAMMYPIIVLIISSLIAIGLIIFVVPVFGDMFSDFGEDLPLPTQVLLNLSDGLRAQFHYFVLVVGALIFGFRKWKASESGSYIWAGFMLRAPVFGKLNRFVAAARFARMLSQMTRSGVPIMDALGIVAGSVGNRVAEKVVQNTVEVVEKGDPLSSALLNQTVYPISMVRMLQAGEKTGSINEMMDSIADYYEDEVDSMLTGLTSLLEPLLMVFLGVVIGGLVICMFLPMFKMADIF